MKFWVDLSSNPRAEHPDLDDLARQGSWLARRENSLNVCFDSDLSRQLSLGLARRE
ncbi:hypothetical protein A2U01_0077258, partial [Trifolium medium]|nr:hypothetical protein [Trifolium medium]